MILVQQTTSPEQTTSPNRTIGKEQDCSYTADNKAVNRKYNNREFSELIKKVKCFIEKNPYLETNLPRCKLVTEGFHRLLAEYKPLIIHAKSEMLSSTSTGYDHWFLQINLDC